MVHTVKSMYLDITGKRKPTLQGRVGDVTEAYTEGEGGNSPQGEKVEEVYQKKG